MKRRDRQMVLAVPVTELGPPVRVLRIHGGEHPAGSPARPLPIQMDLLAYRPRPAPGQVHHARARLVTIDGVTRSIVEWARIYKRPPSSISARIAAGWDPVQAVTQDRATYGKMSLKEKQRYAIARAHSRMKGSGR